MWPSLVYQALRQCGNSMLEQAAGGQMIGRCHGMLNRDSNGGVSGIDWMLGVGGRLGVSGCLLGHGGRGAWIPEGVCGRIEGWVRRGVLAGAGGD